MAFAEVIKVKQGHNSILPIQYDWCLYKKKKHQRFLFSTVHTQRKRYQRTEGESKHCKPSREASRETKLADTLILNVQPPKL